MHSIRGPWPVARGWLSVMNTLVRDSSIHLQLCPCVRPLLVFCLVWCRCSVPRQERAFEGEQVQEQEQEQEQVRYFFSQIERCSWVDNSETFRNRLCLFLKQAQSNQF